MPSRSVVRKRLLSAIWGAGLFLLLLLALGYSLAQSAGLLATLSALLLIFSAAIRTYRKLFPSLVRAHEKKKADRTFVGDGDI